MFTAPGAVPASGMASIKATSVQDSTETGLSKHHHKSRPSYHHVGCSCLLPPVYSHHSDLRLHIHGDRHGKFQQRSFLVYESLEYRGGQ